MSSWNQAQVATAAGQLELAVDPRKRRVGGGTRLGAGPGSSLEFHDFREYVPGDDIRHLDWSVYARTDDLVLRRHRQEVSPRVEIFLDVSLSMGISSEKEKLAMDLTALMATLAQKQGSRMNLFALGTGFKRLGAAAPAAWPAELQAQQLEGLAGLSCLPAPPLAQGSERILISDGLNPEGGTPIVRRLGQGAGWICMIQILNQREMEPEPLGPVRLTDVEQGAIDMLHDEDVVNRYKERFVRHQGEWQGALSGRGPGLITCVTEEGFDAAVKNILTAGLVETKVH